MNNNNQLLEIVKSGDLQKIQEELIIQSFMTKDGLLDSNHWFPFGDDENNLTVIENQQDSPIDALLEIKNNGEDSTLERLLHTKHGSNISVEELNKMYPTPKESIAALSSDGTMNESNAIEMTISGNESINKLVISDSGRGQSKENFLATFCSNNGQKKSEKHNKKYLNGAFGAGIMGPFRHSKEYMCVIISKVPDENITSYTLTTIEKHDDKVGGQVKYLAPHGKPLTVEGSGLVNQRPFGTDIIFPDFNLNDENLMTKESENKIRTILSQKLTSSMFPLVLSNNKRGTSKRIETFDEKFTEDMKEISISKEFKVEGDRLGAKISVAKKESYLNKNGINARNNIGYSSNGRTYVRTGVSEIVGRISSKDDSIGWLAEIKDSMCVDIDVSGTNGLNIFGTSRSYVKTNSFTKSMHSELQKIINNSDELREIAHRRMNDKLQSADITGDNEILKIVDEIIEASAKKNHPAIRNRTKSIEPSKKISEKIVTKDYATYFELVDRSGNPHSYTTKVPKRMEKGRIGKLKFITDASKDFFKSGRAIYDVQLRSISSDGTISITNHLSSSIWHRFLINPQHNGKGFFEIAVPDDLSIYDKYILSIQIITDENPSKFYKFDVPLKIRSKVERQNISSPSKNKDLPKINHILDVTKDQWIDHKIDENNIIWSISNVNGTFDLYFNTDNKVLKSGLGKYKSSQKGLVQKEFKKFAVKQGVSGLCAYEQTLSAAQTGEQLLVAIPSVDHITQLSCQNYFVGEKVQ